MVKNPKPEELQLVNAPKDESPMELMRYAFERGGATPEALEKLVALKIQMDKRSAELEFANAMREFQQDCPPITRSSVAKIPTKGGGSFAYRFADLEEIIDTVRPHLSRRGFSFKFDSRIDGPMLTCVITVRHVNGHEETSSFTLPTASSSAMSDQQRYGAALTFAKRQCLTSVLGLSLTDPVAPGEETSTEVITEEQAATLSALIEEVGADPERFLKWASVDYIHDIRASDYRKCVGALEQRRAR